MASYTLTDSGSLAAPDPTPQGVGLFDLHRASVAQGAHALEGSTALSSQITSGGPGSGGEPAWPSTGQRWPLAL